MNYLAHAYLSYNVPHILVGNMISDFVKGAQKYVYVVSVQQGMELHRAIDSFTDDHPATAKAKNIFRPAYRLYSGAIMDILYDHFLANDESLFSESSLRAFVNNTYLQLEENTSYLPANFLHAFTYMRSDNWLFNYRFHHGIQKSLSGLVRRAAYLSESATAFQLFQEHYSFLNDCYLHFFPDVKQYAKDELEKLLL